MNSDALICKNCGGSLCIGEGEVVAVCEFCKSKFYIPGFQLNRYYLAPEVEFEDAHKKYIEYLEAKNWVKNDNFNFKLIFIPIYRFTGFSVGLTPQKKVVKVEEYVSSIPDFVGELDDDSVGYNFKSTSKKREKIKVETRVNEDYFEYFFDGSFFLEKGYISYDFFNKMKENIRLHSFRGFNREEMETYGEIYVPPDESKMRDRMLERHVSIENLYWDGFFYVSDKPEIVNYEERDFFKNFVDKDVELVFYPIYISVALNKENNLFSVAVDGVTGKVYSSEMFKLWKRKKSFSSIPVALSIVFGLICADGFITTIFLDSNLGYWEFLAGLVLFASGFFLIDRELVKW